MFHVQWQLSYRNTKFSAFGAPWWCDEVNHDGLPNIRDDILMISDCHKSPRRLSLSSSKHNLTFSLISENFNNFSIYSRNLQNERAFQKQFGVFLNRKKTLTGRKKPLRKYHNIGLGFKTPKEVNAQNRIY